MYVDEQVTTFCNKQEKGKFGERPIFYQSNLYQSNFYQSNYIFNKLILCDILQELLYEHYFTISTVII